MKIMKKRTLILLAGAVGIAAAAGFITRSSWMGGSSNAQGPQRPRMVSVELAKAERKSVPVDVDANGTVTPISSVALKSRLETTIVAVHFEDGAKVSEGDLLFTLDSRQIDAQIEQAEGVLAKDQAQLEGAQRDLRRYNDLVGKGATTQVNVDNARTQSDILIGTIKADQAALDNLKVQKSYTTIRAPFAGRISAANVKVGNFVRPADTAPLAVINQMAPVYVTFAVPQRVLVDLREADGEGRLARHRDHPGPSALGDRQCGDGREHRRCDHRHGYRPRHHEQSKRVVVAGDAGRPPSSSSAAKTRSWCRRSPCSAARTAISFSSSRTALPGSSRSRSTAPRRASR